MSASPVQCAEKTVSASPVYSAEKTARILGECSTSHSQFGLLKKRIFKWSQVGHTNCILRPDQCIVAQRASPDELCVCSFPGRLPH